MNAAMQFQLSGVVQGEPYTPEDDPGKSMITVAYMGGTAKFWLEGSDRQKFLPLLPGGAEVVIRGRLFPHGKVPGAFRPAGIDAVVAADSKGSKAA